MVIMDGDNTQNPKYVHEMIKKVKEGNDCVIASRYQEGASVKGLAKYREKLSDIASVYYKLVLNIEGVKDYTCGYRIYTYNIISKLVEKFGEEVVKEKSFACMMELLYKTSIVEAKFAEVPFELRYDQKIGNSKMNVINTMKRSIVTAISLQFKYNKKTVVANTLIGIFLILMPLLLSLITNFSPLNKQGLGHDCGIFSYIAFAMQNGEFMYTGAWDNKGPLLYFLYYIGLTLGGENGIYFIEYLAIFITTLFGYKTIKLVTNSKTFSIIGTIYALSMWVPTNEHGTLSEVFAMPFIMIGIYLFAKCIINDIKLSRKSIIAWGFCSAALAILRLNILLIFLPLFIIIGILLIKNKRAKEIWTWMSYGAIGVAILIIPTIIYLMANNALVECFNSAYLQILGGFNSGTWEDKLKALNKMMAVSNKDTGVAIVMILFIIIGIGLIIAKKVSNNKKQYLLIGTILMLLINMYANALSGAAQIHYFLTFVPIMFITVALILATICEYKNNKIIKIAGTILIIVGIILSGNSYYKLVKEIKERTNPTENEIAYQINRYILENTTEMDKVQMIGGREEAVNANYKTKRLAPTRYSYLPLWDTFKEDRKREIINEVVEKIEIEKPKIIMICTMQEEEFNSLINDLAKWKSFLNQNYDKDITSVKTETAYYRVEG